MVKKRLEMGPLEVESPARHSVSQKWAGTVDGILRVNGYDGFLKNFDESEHIFDPDYAVIIEICKIHRETSSMTASEWAQTLIDDLLKDKLTDGNDKPKSKQAQSTIVGYLFSQYIRTVLEIGYKKYTIACEDHGKGHPKTYFFKRMDGEN